MNQTNYDAYVAGKIIESKPSGFDCDDLNPKLFPYQRDIVRWALRRGKAALFESPGLGKSIQEWEFAKHTASQTGMPAMIFAPLAVAEQMMIEAPDFGYSINICRSRDDVRNGINVANYEILHKFSPEDFGTIIADESSILKAGSFGKTARALTEFASTIPYRLAATATPAPNDMDEILYHAEFLGIMREQEAKALFFVQDGNSSNKMRLKMNAVEDYYQWLASWAVALRRPSDLGYSDDGFIRPPVNYHQITIDLDSPLDTGMLVAVEALGITEQRKARNATMDQRVKATADIANASNEQWLIWCDLNTESEALSKAISDAVEVTGSDSPEHKIDAMRSFKGDICECEQKKRSESITESITEKTKRSGRSPEIRRDETPETENFTLKTQRKEEKLLSNLSNGEKITQRHISPLDLKSSAFPRMNTGNCLTSKAADAPSVDSPKERREFLPQDQKAESDDCTSTMITKQEQCEDYYVHPAISESGNSKTTSKLLIKRCNICGKPNQQARVVVSKTSIWGFGLNLQHSHNMVFCGLGNSFEQYLQAIARQDRFGQQNIVNVYVVVSSADGAVVQNIKRKWVEHDRMYDELIKHVTVYTDLKAGRRRDSAFDANKSIKVPSWLSPTSTPDYQVPVWIDFDAITYHGLPEVQIGCPVGDVLQEFPKWIRSVL